MPIAKASSSAPARSTLRTGLTPGLALTREAAEDAFDQIGISIRDHRGEQPG
jgi:hypothetical protein